ncbi:MAG: hypothetical protein KGL18_00375 [Burkholderiales bacterium]|nr:hypothetical protein [Burkholderiales bacterium]MDE1928968.1 hypothetical protein [Burkholderiales bacterium]MDE2158324.1 hypothetical protein [Burkholderiales bacterium]MDE2501417.1 hypothetical protein [Burkholderiales bacterium]
MKIRHHRPRSVARAAPLLLAFALGACATTGAGGGEFVGPGAAKVPVIFQWTSPDGGLSGELSAALPHATYRGRYFEITRGTRSARLQPMWVGWPMGWDDWPYWGDPPYGAYSRAGFDVHYSGTVVANLGSADGRRMRCRLHLVDPARGLSAGADGQCQIQGGRTFRARF